MRARATLQPVHARTDMQICISFAAEHTHAHTHTHTHTHTQVHMQVYAQTPAYTHACSYEYACTHAGADFTRACIPDPLPSPSAHTFNERQSANEDIGLLAHGAHWRCLGLCLDDRVRDRLVLLLRVAHMGPSQRDRQRERARARERIPAAGVTCGGGEDGRSRAGLAGNFAPAAACVGQGPTCGGGSPLRSPAHACLRSQAGKTHSHSMRVKERKPSARVGLEQRCSSPRTCCDRHNSRERGTPRMC